jgi:hypothetical protein
MAAAILAPAELPHKEYLSVPTPSIFEFLKTNEIAAARSRVAGAPPAPARYRSTKALYPCLLIATA